jgi:hypothetical protein
MNPLKKLAFKQAYLGYMKLAIQYQAALRKEDFDWTSPDCIPFYISYISAMERMIRLKGANAEMQGQLVKVKELLKRTIASQKGELLHNTA